MNLSYKVLALYINKTKTDTLSLDAGGVVGDKYHDRDKNRSVLITSTKSYNVSKSNKIELKFGELGENIIVDFDIYSLPIGTKLQIGTALLQLSQNCTLCNSLSKINPKLPKLLKNDRGIFAFVLEDGVITKSDTIMIKGV